MTTHESPTTIQQAVLDRVHDGKVTRLPRAYFLLRIIGIAALAITLLLASTFIVSFVVFAVHETGEHLLLGFGLPGWTAFGVVFPWMLVAVAVALVFLLQWIVARFTSAYRLPVLPVSLTLLALAACFGMAASLTPLHPALLQEARQGGLPFGDVYQDAFKSHPDEGIFRGTVEDADGSGFTIRHDDFDSDGDDGAHKVILIPGSPCTQPVPGERVLVFGTENDGHIDASCVRPLPPPR